MDISGSSRVGDLVGGKKMKAARKDGVMPARNQASRANDLREAAERAEERGSRRAPDMMDRAIRVHSGAQRMASAASRVFAHQPVAVEGARSGPSPATLGMRAAKQEGS